IAVPVMNEQFVPLSVFEHLPVDQTEPVPTRRWDHYVSLDHLHVHAAAPRSLDLEYPLKGRSWRAPFRFFSACIGTMNLKRVSPSESRRAFSGSWKVPSNSLPPAPSLLEEGPERFRGSGQFSPVVRPQYLMRNEQRTQANPGS